MAKFTLLELNLDGAQLSANAPFGSDPTLDDGERVSGSEGSDDAGSGGTKRPWLAALVGLLFLVVVALLVKKKVGGSDDGEDPLTEDPTRDA